ADRVTLTAPESDSLRSLAPLVYVTEPVAGPRIATTPRTNADGSHPSQAMTTNSESPLAEPTTPSYDSASNRRGAPSAVITTGVGLTPRERPTAISLR